MKNTKGLLLLAMLTLTLATDAQHQGKSKKIFHIHNASPVACTAKVVSLPWEPFRKRYAIIDTSSFRIIHARTRKEVPLQLERLGGKDAVNLLLQVDIPARDSIALNIEHLPRAAVKPLTYGRFVPERKDDFAWENDHIAFRAYGKALESTPKENAHGFDVWVKRTRELVINERYRRNDYHRDNGDGLDYYQVGSTLGAGNVAPFFKDSVWYPGNFTKWEILDNGPLRTSFKLYYDPVILDGRQVRSVKTISLDVGTYLNRITVQYDVDGLDSLPVVIGIIKRKDPGVIHIDEQQGLAAYWEPKDPQFGTTGVSVLANGKVKSRITPQQLLLQIKIAAGKPFTYEAGACWDREGELTSAAAWLSWLQQQEMLDLAGSIHVTYR